MATFKQRINERLTAVIVFVGLLAIALWQNQPNTVVFYTCYTSDGEKPSNTSNRSNNSNETTFVPAVAKFTGSSKADISSANEFVSNLLSKSNLCESLFCPFRDNDSALVPDPFRQEPPSIDLLRRIQQNVILVVVFNYENGYFVAPLLRALYHQLFREIYYCGQSLTSLAFVESIAAYFPRSLAQSLEPFYFTYSLADRQPIHPNVGETTYYCLNLAVKSFKGKSPVGSEPDGVFVIHDDVAINYWQILNQTEFDFSKSHMMPWFVVYDAFTKQGCTGDKCRYLETPPETAELQNGCVGPLPWETFPDIFEETTKNFFRDFNQLAVEQNGSVYQNCLFNMILHAKGVNRVFGGLNDIFYIARRDFAVVLPMFELGMKHQLYQEMAVATVLNGCLDASMLGSIDITGWIHWSLRDKLLYYYDPHRLYLHPLKLSSVVDAMFTQNPVIGPENINEICLFCHLFNHRLVF